MTQITPGTWLKINGESDADYAWSMEGVTNGSARLSTQIDLGAAPRESLITWVCSLKVAATPTLQYSSVDFYYAAGFDNDATTIWAGLGQTDASYGDIDQLYNLVMFGQVTIEELDTTVMRAGGTFFFPWRYLTLVGFNGYNGAALDGTDSNFQFHIAPGQFA